MKSEEDVPDNWGLQIDRRQAERIVLRVPGRARPIVITCGRVDTNSVKLFINAEKDIVVDREEVDAAKRGKPRPDLRQRDLQSAHVFHEPEP